MAPSTPSAICDVVFVTSSYGLGETVVQGAVNPDEFYVYKPALRAGKRSIVRRNLGGKAIKQMMSDRKKYAGKTGIPEWGGYTGYVNFGVTAFFAIGAYSTVVWHKLVPAMPLPVMILIGGASAIKQNGMGAFQEERQVLIATPFCKFAHGVEIPARIPFYVEMAVRNSIYGRPGASYLDMPDDSILGEVEEDPRHALRTGGRYRPRAAG